jgi:hypothetical protein
VSGIHHGACFCGAVEIEVTGEPIDAGFCHCRSCRAYSGAPFVAFTIWPVDRFRVSRGGDLLGSYNKAGISDRRFCTRCGGHLCLDHPDLGVVDVRAAILPTVRFAPRAHFYYAERVIAIGDGLPKFRDFPAHIGGSGELCPE